MDWEGDAAYHVCTGSTELPYLGQVQRKRAARRCLRVLLLLRAISEHGNLGEERRDARGEGSATEGAVCTVRGGRGQVPGGGRAQQGVSGDVCYKKCLFFFIACARSLTTIPRQFSIRVQPRLHSSITVHHPHDLRTIRNTASLLRWDCCTALRTTAGTYPQ